MKTQPYPNEQFNSVSEFVDFCKENKVFGDEANKLKKKMDKQTAIPEPRIQPEADPKWLEPKHR